jgi:hypothetical protein
MDPNKPRIIKRACGGWLALSPTTSPLHYGVEGETREEALANLEIERQRWEAAFARAQALDQ